MSHAENRRLGLRAMLKRTSAMQPSGVCRFGGRMGGEFFRTGQDL
ncbi:hypothetical protein [Pseudomonas sp. ATCC 13867]|nr:hypothetical protein [Pseudomonas sp. ATCC 13867]